MNTAPGQHPQGLHAYAQDSQAHKDDVRSLAHRNGPRWREVLIVIAERPDLDRPLWPALDWYWYSLFSHGFPPHSRVTRSGCTQQMSAEAACGKHATMPEYFEAGDDVHPSTCSPVTACAHTG